VDAAGSTLGRVVYAGMYEVSFVTSTGYLATLSWSGLYTTSTLYFVNYSTGVCGGDPYLLSSSTVASAPLYGRTLVWSPSVASFVAPRSASIAADGSIMSVQPSGLGISLAGVEDAGVCQAAGASTNYMWPMELVSASSAGLPATVVPPLTIP
jgi:hypothetical protein